MRVVIVEDQILFREFLATVLVPRLGLELVGQAGDGEEALQVIRQSRPDLVILDILIPKLSGIRVARTVNQEWPRTRILGLSSEIDIKTVQQVHQLRLAGFIDKNQATMEHLTEAIQAIRNNKRFVSSSLQNTIQKLVTDPQSFQKILTKREQEVLTLIGDALSDQEIGNLLKLSHSSIQSHRRNLSRKLGAHSTPELIRFAHESGFWKASFRRMGLTDTYHLHE